MRRILDAGTVDGEGGVRAGREDALSLYRRIRLWLAIPLVHRLVLLTGAGLVGFGYSRVWVGSDVAAVTAADVQAVFLRVVTGLLCVTVGAALLGAGLLMRK